MWKLALVQGPSIVIYEAGGSSRKQANDFATAVQTLLKEGWEPFAADSGNAVMVWFRIRAG
jgi:hypothetical protein